jgi:hypothetical protein
LQRVKHFNGIVNDSRLNGSGKSFEISVFNTSLDIILMQLKDVSKATKCCVFSCLQPQQVLSYTVDELFGAATKLANDNNNYIIQSTTYKLISHTFNISLKVRT